MRAGVPEWEKIAETPTVSRFPDTNDVDVSIQQTRTAPSHILF